MNEGWPPTLRIRDFNGVCRLSLGSYAYGDGPTLQDAADALVARLLSLAMSLRSGSVRITRELGPPDLRWLEFLYELGEIAATGDDIRERIFGYQPEAA